MRRLVLLVVLVALGMNRTAHAQSVASAQRLQRMVSAPHAEKLRGGTSTPGATLPVHLPSISHRAMIAGRGAMLKQQLRIPLHSRVDLTLGGRVGVFGMSSTARVRLRF